jgi:hypothetical protein
MDGVHHEVYRYRLRSSGAVPINPAEFLVQTFGANRNQINVWPATSTITKTTDFVGASTTGEYTSANFQRLPYLTAGGIHVFSGQTVGRDIFIDEDDIPGS